MAASEKFPNHTNEIVSDSNLIHQTRGQKAIRGEKINSDRLVFDQLEPQKPYKLFPDSNIPSRFARSDLAEVAPFDEYEWTSLVEVASEDENVIAIIHACEQPFWLLDMRADEAYHKAGVPFLLAQPSTTHSSKEKPFNVFYKGIRPGRSLKFGRNYTYDNRFEYSPDVSRSHFEIICDDDGNLYVKDLDSLNGTSVATWPEHVMPNQMRRERSREDRWMYTPHISENRDDVSRKRDGQLYISLGGHDYPLLHRDATSFNGHVDANLSTQLDIIIDSDSPIIQSVYDQLIDQYDVSLPVIDKLKIVEKVVHNTFRESDDKRVEDERAFDLPDGGKFLVLSDYVRAHSGVCRQRALLSACLLEKMQSEGLISGVIHVERNYSENRGEDGHEWATFQESPESDVYVIDPMHRFVGKKEDSLGWDYRRP